MSDAGYLEPYFGNGTSSGIESVGSNSASDTVNVYNLSGVELRHGVSKAEATKGLAKGVYVVGNSKYVVK